MTEAERILIRLRHYTRTSSKDRIRSEERMVARDQNKVFVEHANRSPLSPRQAETTYLLKRGKGNAYIEFDACPEEIHAQTNSLTGTTELFLLGDVDLATRHPQGFDNR